MALRKRDWILGALVLAAVVAFLVERLVVTDREAIERLVERAVGAVANRDFVTLRDCLDEDYAADGRDREAAARYVEQQVTRYDPTRLRADVGNLVVEGDRARAVLRVRGRVLTQGRIEVTAEFVKRPEGWRILSAQLGGRIRVDNLPTPQ